MAADRPGDGDHATVPPASGGAAVRARRRALLAALAWVAFAAAGGVVWATQFEPRAYVVAPWIALVPLLLLMASPRPAWLGLVHGVAYWLASIPWIASTLETYGGLPRAGSWALLLLLAAYLGLYSAAFTGLGARLWRRGGWPTLLGLPALWVVLELVRGVLGSGFPWNLAAYAWVDVPGALPLASWVGPWGISYLVVLANVGVVAALVWRRPQLGALALLVPLALLPLAGRYARPTSRPGPPQPVRLLQPNIANLVHYEPGPAAVNYARVLAMSEAACDRAGALVVWPESAGWPFEYPSDASFAQDVETLAARGCPLIFNSAFRVEDGWRNSAFLLAHGVTSQRADKRHLVPFGEYVPARKLFPFIEGLARGVGDFTPATGVRLLTWGRERLAMSICFEVIFPGEVAEGVRRGATALVTITNDAWYGDTSAPWQHFRAARFRAAEQRRPLLRAAITGISALVRPDGSVAALLGPFAQGTLRGELRGGQGLSPYARHPAAGPWLAVILTLAAFAAGGWRRPPGKIGLSPAPSSIPPRSDAR
jgi:apolipoprotein N-acyltransferase